MWLNDEIKAAVRRKEAAWKVVLQLGMKRQKNDVSMEAYPGEEKG